MRLLGPAPASWDADLLQQLMARIEDQGESGEACSRGRLGRPRPAQVSTTAQLPRQVQQQQRLQQRRLAKRRAGSMPGIGTAG